MEGYNTKFRGDKCQQLIKKIDEHAEGENFPKAYDDEISVWEDEFTVFDLMAYK